MPIMPLEIDCLEILRIILKDLVSKLYHGVSNNLLLRILVNEICLSVHLAKVSLMLDSLGKTHLVIINEKNLFAKYVTNKVIVYIIVFCYEIYFPSKSPTTCVFIGILALNLGVFGY